MYLLVLNAGSSSQKSSLYRLGTELPQQPPEPLWLGHIDWTASDFGSLTIKSNGVQQQTELANRDQAL
mgnify:FL=1